MSQYFTEADAGERYASYRPKVHHVALQWLEQVIPGKRFQRAIDVACGTGDSTVPLKQVADQVVGIDSSDEMINAARQRGLNVHRADYTDLASYGHFDLISTCMAFHWFDAESAISSYKSASKQGAVWLIYNFAFGGHSTSDEFNQWFLQDYLKKYPSPPRGRSSNVSTDADPNLQLLAKDKGWLPVEFSKDGLFGYFSTQSNIEHQLREGITLEELREPIMRQLAKVDTSGSFKYVYTYEILRYTGSQQGAQPDASGAG
jgi:SAM-dependent methyltransferase